MVDVFTMGETMLRLSPPNQLRLEQAQQFDMFFGGSESNVAANLARLGRRTQWFSKLPNNPLGRACAAHLRGHGVDTSLVRWAENQRMGLYFVEYGDAPRGIQVLYDRAGSAASTLTPDDLPIDAIHAAKWVHLTGITPALSPTCAQTVQRVVQAAQQANVFVSFDVNYRALLWQPQQAAEVLMPLCQKADLIFVAARDAKRLFGIERVQQLHEQFGGLVVMSNGADGAVACDGNIYRAGGVPASIVDRLGAGDAFASGVIYKLLEKATIADALAFGTALASLALSVRGDIATVQPEEVEQLVLGVERTLRR